VSVGGDRGSLTGVSRHRSGAAPLAAPSAARICGWMRSAICAIGLWRNSRYGFGRCRSRSRTALAHERRQLAAVQVDQLLVLLVLTWPRRPLYSQSR